MDEDAPLELLWQELRASPLWTQVEQMLLTKRDRMVAMLITDKAKAGEHPGQTLARRAQIVGYIEACNAIVAAPAQAEEKARKQRIVA